MLKATKQLERTHMFGPTNESGPTCKKQPMREDPLVRSNQ
jgi:hypothetical protein